MPSSYIHGSQLLLYSCTWASVCFYLNRYWHLPAWPMISANAEVQRLWQYPVNMSVLFAITFRLSSFLVVLLACRQHSESWESCRCPLWMTSSSALRKHNHWPPASSLGLAYTGRLTLKRDAGPHRFSVDSIQSCYMRVCHIDRSPSFPLLLDEDMFSDWMYIYMNQILSILLIITRIQKQIISSTFYPFSMVLVVVVRNTSV